MSGRNRLAIGVAAVAVGGVLGAFVLNGPAKISLSSHSDGDHHGHSSRLASHWVFSTLNNQNDTTFNQLLGINNRGQIVGYFGSGEQGHPNKGYQLTLSHRFSFYQNQNVPGSAQTQVIGINDFGVSVGFWSAQNTASQTNNNFGFYAWHGHSHSVSFPTTNNSTPPVNQLLGVNDSNVAVGFYTGNKGNAHGYTYNIASHRFHSIKIHGATSVTPSGINNNGDITGFFTGAGGVTKAFLLRSNGKLVTLAFPHASSTMGFGVNDSREVVGTYMTGSGDNAKSFGFTWTSHAGFAAVNDPLGPGATTINGVNNAGDIVGFYTDAAGNTDGFLLAASHHAAAFAPPLSPAVTVTVTPTPTMSAKAITAPSATPSVTPTAATTTAPVASAGPTHF